MIFWIILTISGVWLIAIIHRFIADTHDRPSQEQGGGREYMFRFLVVAACVLALLLGYAWYEHPRTPDDNDLIFKTGTVPEEELSFWQRLLQSTRRIEEAPEPVDVVDVVNTQAVYSYGINGMKMSQDQLSLRETAIAEYIMLERSDAEEAESWRVVKNAFAKPRYENYEERRFLCDVLRMRYFESEDPKLLEKYRETAAFLAEHSLNNFEDHYNLGLANLLDGKPKEALPVISYAYEIWPVRGRMKGNVYFVMMCTYAVLGYETEAYGLLENFSNGYPDWVYIENYMPDVDNLEAIYPDAALLTVMRGRMHQAVYNYRAAREAYRTALDANRLSTFMSRVVEIWFDETDPQKCMPVAYTGSVPGVSP
jgi:hypothetical protein